MAAVTAMALGIAGLGAVGTAEAVAPKALILGSTVTGGVAPGGTSWEEHAAAALGYTVEVVNDATWVSKTATDFDDYQVIIIGDPTCGDTVDGVAGTHLDWQDAVMDSGGNRVIIGTDPVWHYSFVGSGPAELISNGIAFAGAVTGATGAYVDISCHSDATDAGMPMTFLDGLSTSPAGSFTAEYPDCFSKISIVAATGPTATLTNAELSGWSCSVHKDFKTWGADYTPLAIATDAPTKPYCAKEVEGGALVCGAPYILVAGAGVTVTSNIALAPLTDTNPVGTDHTVTATITDGNGSPVVGEEVTFLITGGPDAGQTYSGTTDVNGQVSWTYTNNGTAGTDSISASFTDASGAIQKATATKTWEAAAPHDTATTYTGKTGGQYSDPVPLSANLKDTTDSVPLPGKTIDFIVGSQNTSAGPTDASGDVSTSLTLDQIPGGTSVFAGFAGDAGYNSSFDKQPFTVAKEDCTIAYSGDTLVAPATPTNLAADLGEPDSSLGDRSGKTVTFHLNGVLTGPSSYTATTDGSGHAATTANLLPDVYDVAVSFAGDDYYLGCKTPPGTLVTVQAAGAKVTGGGWISISTGRTNFGFNAIPVAGGWKGQFQMRSNSGKNLFHSGNITLLTSSGNTAKWTGTGKWNGVTGYKFTISVVDNGSSGSKKLDTVNILIQKPDSTTAFSTGGAQNLKGGNITVHK